MNDVNHKLIDFHALVVRLKLIPNVGASYKKSGSYSFGREKAASPSFSRSSRRVEEATLPYPPLFFSVLSTKRLIMLG